MNIELLEKAKERVPSIPVLINMVSKRVRQLNADFRPYIKPESPNEDKLETALREIAAGVLIAEIEFVPPTESDA